ncbi:hypothetical protein BDV93DRAFT_528544, partial [Ceratobasidium sp. AG-I]
MNSHYTPSSQTGSRHGCTRLAEIQKGGVGQALSKRRVPRTEGGHLRTRYPKVIHPVPQKL